MAAIKQKPITLNTIVRGLLLFCGLLVSLSPLRGQTKGTHTLTGIPPVVCYASGESGHARVGPPPEFLDSLKRAVKTADFVVSYIGFPDSAKKAMDYALSIWESLISSDVPIYVEARWERLGSNTLGSCGANSYMINFEGAPMADTWYPVALAEKITGREMTGPANPDMTASFNSIMPWYMGTTQNTPSDRFDLVSTILHEVAHGLGMNGFFDANPRARSGSYGYSDGLPAAFDRRVETKDGVRLTNPAAFTNPSATLYYAMVSDWLFAASPAASFLAAGERPRLYAPADYTVGSSIYHLNDGSYPYGTENALMTSSAGRGEAVHSPGPLTTGILDDLGWKHMWIRFTPLKDREETSLPLRLDVSVVSDLGVSDTSVFVVFSSDGFGEHRDSVPLSRIPGTGGYTAEFLPPPTPGVLSYYVAVTDTLGRRFTSPTGAPQKSWKLTLGTDTIKPVIFHTPAKYLLSTATQFDIVAEVTDNARVDTVYLLLFLNGQELPPLGMISAGDNLYHVGLPLGELGLLEGDILEYRIVAIDNAAAANRRILPEEGNYSMKMEGIAAPAESYFTDFNSSGSDFILYDFRVVQITGFNDPALHSPHPYPSPDTDDGEFQFTTLLRVPIIVKANGRIAWDEVVLVEPGEVNATYESVDFYDYVIAEASKDQGKSWQPLLDGYDSGSNEAWKSAYNQQISGQNSISAGSRELFVRREFPITSSGHFHEGDTLLIRFRLYSDPYAHGWGWAIDNLAIQQNLTSAEITASPLSSFLVWPNPTSDIIHLLPDAHLSTTGLGARITDLTGRTLMSLPPGSFIPGVPATVNLQHLKPGFYIVLLQNNAVTIATRKMIKH